MGAKILVVEDSASVRREIRSVLERVLDDAEIIEAEDGLQAFKLSTEHELDLVLCDLVMPRFDGVKFLAMRASQPHLLNIPVIMLTAENDANRKVEVLDRGASDYVTKPFNEKELVARVRVHYRVKRLQDELRQANDKLQQLATIDGLTGLLNRRQFDVLLLKELQRTLRYKTPASVILFDLDHFKSVNDTHGHVVGDQVLRSVSKVVAQDVRTTDHAARYGGEEFAVILPQVDSEGARTLAERLRQNIAALQHEGGTGGHFSSTASFGIACFGGSGEPIGPKCLLERADRALYLAKASGRNQVVVWTKALPGDSDDAESLSA